MFSTIIKDGQVLLSPTQITIDTDNHKLLIFYHTKNDEIQSVSFTIDSSKSNTIANEIFSAEKLSFKKDLPSMEESVEVFQKLKKEGKLK